MRCLCGCGAGDNCKCERRFVLQATLCTLRMRGTAALCCREAANHCGSQKVLPVQSVSTIEPSQEVMNLAVNLNFL